MIKKTIKKEVKPKCGLCGKRKKLTKTYCCNMWICDDEANYVLFSYAKNSCFRNHRRFTLCSYHFNEGHKGKWEECEECKKDFDTENYVYFGTNEYNFYKLTEIPTFEPTKCTKCGKIIRLGYDEYMLISGKYLCGDCVNYPFS